MQYPEAERTGIEEAGRVPEKSTGTDPDSSRAEQNRDNAAQAILRDGERLDDLQLGGMMFIQNPSLFCFGMDAVLLSDFARIRPGEKVIDLCSGSGILPVLLSAKTRASHLTGVELFAENAALARRNAELNHLDERVSIIQGDVRDYRSLLKEASCEAVTCNPPYIQELPPHHKDAPKRDLVTAARHEIFCTLEDVVCAAAYVLKSSGRFFMVHRPFRLPQIIRALSAHHLEPKRMRLVHPYADREPNMVLIEAVKGGRPHMIVEPPLVVYRAKNTYTDEILSIYGITDRSVFP